MVTAKESQTCQQFAALNSPYLDHMAVLHNEQNCTLPSVVPTASISNVAFLGQQNSGLHVLDTLQMNGVGGFIPYPVLKPYPKVTQCVLPDGRGVPGMPMDTSCIPQKRFLIFDHSGNHTRMFVTASFSPQTPIAASNSPATHSGLHLDQQFLTKELVNENWDENHVTEREDDLLEDSEEIDALFYSDTEDDYDEGSDADGENDEVASIMAHTPLSIENSFDKAKHTDEVASSDGTQKRRKLFDGSTFKTFKTSTFSYPAGDLLSPSRNRRFPPSNQHCVTRCLRKPFLLLAPFTQTRGNRQIGSPSSGCLIRTCTTRKCADSNIMTKPLVGTGDSGAFQLSLQDVTGAEFKMFMDFLKSLNIFGKDAPPAREHELIEIIEG